MKKQQIISLFLLLMLLSGCSGSGGSSQSSDTAAAGAEIGFDTVESLEQAAANDAAGVTARSNAKLILRAELQAEAQDFAKANTEIQQLVNTHNGYMELMNVGGNDGKHYANFTLRIPPEHFDAFLTAVGNTCNVLYTSRSTEDIGEQYFDISARLAAVTTKQERLLALLDQADKMEDIISLENALSDTQYQIEQLTGTLRQYDSLVGYATINISLSEVQDFTAIQQGNSFLARLTASFQTGSRSFVLFLQSILLVCAVLWPMLVLAGIILLIIFYLRRRKKHAMQKTTQKTTQETTQEENTPKL